MRNGTKYKAARDPGGQLTSGLCFSTAVGKNTIAEKGRKSRNNSASCRSCRTTVERTRAPKVRMDDNRHASAIDLRRSNEAPRMLKLFAGIRSYKRSMRVACEQCESASLGMLVCDTIHGVRTAG
jgi:hypothetical protein